MKKTLIIFLLTALLLGAVSYGLIIVETENARAHHLELMQTLLPGSEQFVREAYSGEDANIRSVHKAENGFVIETVTRGYVDDITMLIAVSNEGKVVGLVVCEAHETFGLGSKSLNDHVFLSQFLNSGGIFEIGAVDAFSGATGAVVETGDTMSVDGISGATVTSKAIVRCVNSAVSYVTGADAGSGATSWGG